MGLCSPGGIERGQCTRITNSSNDDGENTARQCRQRTQPIGVRQDPSFSYLLALGCARLSNDGLTQLTSGTTMGEASTADQPGHASAGFG